MKFGIIFGAKSFEHEISIVSAIVLKNVLKWDLEFVFCDYDRKFYHIPPKDMRANFFASGEYKKCKKLVISNGGFYLHSMFGAKKIEVDTYINLIHGMDGEDGKMASLLEFFGINFIGPRLEASVMSFNKELTKLLAKKIGINTLDYEVLRRGDLPSISYPFILKPLRLGSSIGVSVVKDENDLEYALDVAFEFDKEVLVEPFIGGVKEYNLAGLKVDDEIKFSIIEEPSKREFLDYEQKYLNFSNEKKVAKAEISAQLEVQIKDAFTKIYDSGFDGALIRCDFFVIDDKVFLNEINPNPGSLANYLFDDFGDVLKQLANSLPKEQNIFGSYKFLTSITHSKGGKI
ncbi:D-alanine--D-alanine ligase [Campylobacter gastrosuis]|uniref:D-alanine--D-alanine ligase n=1 Tax=Campylobacter gastrosuis TaxID=2974576 RepID=A0ABT7HNV0_9BACT|nr:D-alanine--D-alanine ligase [Campylobacter gastrosuis]MDL0088308.1 D-alanine--D-alanine ligase [Campylobacter gastrosuis]